MRDLLIIIAMCLAALGIGLWLYFYGPISVSTNEQASVTQSVQHVSAEVEAPASKEVSFTVIGHGSRATGVSARKNYAIYTKTEYARIWKLTGSTEKMPTIDFSKAYVIAVFAGTRTTGGHAISVDRIEDTGDSRHVSVLIEKPGVGCITSQTLTSPYQFIRVPFSSASLGHTDVEVETPCKQ